MTSPLSSNFAGLPVLPTAQAQQERVDRILGLLAPSATGGPAAVPLFEDLVKAAQRVNETLRPYGVEFEMKESRVITRIIDIETGEVIRQIPVVAILSIAEHLDDLPGLLVDTQA